MTTEHIEGRDELARHVPWIGVALVVAVAIPVGILRGAPSVVLWLAFTALASAVLLFWEALRTALDPTSAGDAIDIDDEGVPAELETRKKAALQALRDIEFERSIGRLSEDDFKGLEVKYRDEARAAMRAIDEGLGPWLARAEALFGKSAPLTEEGKAALMAMADGDGRYFLNLVEEVFAWNRKNLIDANGLMAALQKRAPSYDKDREEHYNLISAWHKATRGSDPDAALYWFCRMLEGGEDPLFLARRMIRAASEDVGLADPTALMICNEAAAAYERLGSPEGELALAQAALHLATAPKSNAAYVAYKAARAAARETGSLTPPAHILNAPTTLMKQLGYGAGYQYDHDTEGQFSGQNYFPDDMERQTFYQPGGAGREAPIREKLEQWAKQRRERSGD